MADASLTWLGHASFRLDSPGGKRIYVDPWLENPKCPESEKEPERCDVIAVTHGHDDHVGSAIELSQKFGPLPIVAMIELKGWLKANGAQADELPGSNKGGTVEAAGVKFTLTNAFHSGSAPDGGPTPAKPAGIVVELENGTKVYFAGDTCVFGDMELIGRIYAPDVAVLPIGGHFTMDPREAAVACELVSAKRVVPCHYGTFPLLTGTPDELRQLAKDVEIVVVDPGGLGRAVRERWFGATGRRVPEIAVEGELDDRRRARPRRSVRRRADASGARGRTPDRRADRFRRGGEGCAGASGGCNCAGSCRIGASCSSSTCAS